MVEDYSEIQIALEKEAADLTLNRFMRRHEMAEARGDAENSDTGRLVVRSLVARAKDRLEDLLGYSASGKPGRKTALAKYLLGTPLTPEDISFLALRAVINQLFFHKTEAASDSVVARHISIRLVDELFLRSLKRDEPQLVKRWQKECEDRALTRASARTFMMRQSRNLEMNWSYVDESGLEWTDDVQLKVGRMLLEVIAESTNICYLKSIKVRPKVTKKCVYITQAFKDYIDEAQDVLIGMSQWYLPMVVPPIEWSIEDGLYGGGYLSKETKRYPIVKRGTTDWLDQIIDNDPEVLVSALNAIQNTPWRINKTVLEAIEHIFNLDKGIAGLPNSSEIPVPPAPEEYSKDYRRECWEVHEINRKQLTKRLYVLQVLWLGKKFSEYPEIYFPHDLDSRGRAYPKPAFMNPQGPDYVKALLEFADGKALKTSEAAAWLAVHVANCWGEDKLALDDRIAWTESHEDLIRSVAENPLDDLRWTEADDPFQFLAAAVSWRGYLEEGLDYVCYTPIAVDATCSGLQHYSAMLRDPVGGKAVNLTDCDQRQDVYMDVANVATDLIKKDLGTDKHNLAQAWLDFGVSRKITKRSVMVVPYAATFVSCMNYTRDGVKERLDAGEKMPWAGELQEFNVYGARKIWEAIEQTVVAASDAMRWISSSASAYSKNKENTYLMWGTPSGFVVRQRKANYKPWRMDTILDGSRIRMIGHEEQPTLDSQKMASSTPPSFVHSLDAAHMCLSIDAAVYEGIDDFGVVHDSFSTHAYDMPIFSQCIRDTFFEMYETQDILAGLRDQLQSGLEEELAPMPVKGDLDLSEVRNSAFFFS